MGRDLSEIGRKVVTSNDVDGCGYGTCSELTCLKGVRVCVCVCVCVCVHAFTVFLCEWINQAVLFSTGNSIQYPGITQNGK